MTATNELFVVHLEKRVSGGEELWMKYYLKMKQREQKILR